MDIVRNIELLVDSLMPDLSPYETSMYLFLFRHAYMSQNPSGQVRMGHRTIAELYGRGPKRATPSRQHVIRQLNSLEEKGCIRISDTNREGTLYKVIPPGQIPSVIERIAVVDMPSGVVDYFNDPQRRREVYERDDWKCQYCGTVVDESNVTLDHYIPQCSGGTHSEQNLRTCCLTCNSVKSGKSYEEAAVALLDSIRRRALRSGGDIDV